MMYPSYRGQMLLFVRQHSAINELYLSRELWTVRSPNTTCTLLILRDTVNNKKVIKVNKCFATRRSLSVVGDINSSIYVSSQIGNVRSGTSTIFGDRSEAERPALNLRIR